MSLSINNIVKKYNDKVVVDHLNFEIKEPGVYALLGTNGAGKTTSLRIILGMLAHDEGSVLWNNALLDISTVNVGYLAEERGLYPKYSLIDQLLYFAKLKNVPKDVAMKRIKEWSNMLQVDEYIFPKATKKKKAKIYAADMLSKGNQQKIQLMSALISDPELIVLDEPLSGLDPVNTDLFKNIIHKIANEGNKYIIMSSHQMPVIEEFCSDITILDHGKTVLSGNLDLIKKDYGRVNLFVKCDKDISTYIEKQNLTIKEKLPSEYHLKVSGEEQAMKFLKELIDNQVNVIKFELREPSLHEIFIEKVGKQHE